MVELRRKSAARLDREMKHLFQNLEGIENMTQFADAMFVIDSNAEEIAVKEARRMGVPVFRWWIRIAIRTCGLDYSGQRRCAARDPLFTSKISESVIEGRNAYAQSQVCEATSGRGPGSGGWRRVRRHERPTTVRKSRKATSWKNRGCKIHWQSGS